MDVILHKIFKLENMVQSLKINHRAVIYQHNEQLGVNSEREEEKVDMSNNPHFDRSLANLLTNTNNGMEKSNKKNFMTSFRKIRPPGKHKKLDSNHFFR